MKKRRDIYQIKYLYFRYLYILWGIAKLLIEKGVLVREKVKSPIIDPVHRSIPVTDLEYRVIDTREFQRLRHILQNSTAYQTFPSNTNTRFPHSLGVMHIAGNMFINALANSSYKNLKKLLKGLNDAVVKTRKNTDGLKEASPEELQRRLSDWTDKPAFVHKPVKGKKYVLEDFEFSADKEKYSDYFLICTAYEAVRIGALVHDVGHMPLSHIFEDAATATNNSYWDTLDADKDVDKKMSTILREEKGKRIRIYKDSLMEYQVKQVKLTLGKDDDGEESDSKGQFELHELGGLVIFNDICSTILKEKIEGEFAYDKLITAITKEILLSFPTQGGEKFNKNSLLFKQSKKYLFWGFFHSFFANSFVDSDRLDYSLRDPISSGISLAHFNLELLYNNIQIGNSSVDGKDIYYVAWLAKATATIELFFHQRYLGYQYIAFNHSVMRTNAIAKQIISGILYRTHNTDGFINIQEIAKDMGMYNKESEQNFFPKNDVIDFDDAWFRTLFTLVLKSLCDNPTTVSDHADLFYLKFLLEVYLHRKSQFIRTFWKSDVVFYDWHLSMLKRGYPEDTEKELKERVDSFLLDTTKYKLFMKAVIVNIEKRLKLKQINIWVISENYSPKIFSTKKDSFPVFKGLDDEGNPLGFCTPTAYLRSFRKVDEISPKFNIFLLGSDVDDRGKLEDALAIIDDAFISSLNIYEAVI